MLTDFLSLSSLNQTAIYLEKCQIFLQRFLEIFSAIDFHFNQKRLAPCNYEAYYFISYVGMDDAYKLDWCSTHSKSDALFGFYKI